MPTNKWYSIRQADMPMPNDTSNMPMTEVMIYEEIGTFGIGAKQFASDFAAITTPRIHLRINSAGGDVFDGLAIYQAIRQHPAEVAVTIDGLAASIASVIALAGKTVSIAKNAYLMVHNPWTFAMGNAGELRKQADLLDKLAGTSAEIYAGKTGKKPEEMRATMDAETWFDAEEAKAFGLADAIVDGDETIVPAAVAKAMLKFNPPEKLRKIAASLIQRSADQNLEEQQRQEIEARELADLTARELEVINQRQKANNLVG